MVLVGPVGLGQDDGAALLAGLEALSAGSIRIGERVVDDVAPRERDIAMVFQDYALYPQMSVRQNLAFGLKMRKLAEAEIGRRVDEAAACSGSTRCSSASRAQLSGGQRQRVALGRALVRDPQVFLMDEPLSNLDAKLRAQTRAEIRRCSAGRHDDGLRDARPGRGDDDGRPDRDHARRRARAGRRPGRGLRAAGEHVRRRLHRQPGDEPRPVRGRRGATAALELGARRGRARRQRTARCRAELSSGCAPSTRGSGATDAGARRPARRHASTTSRRSAARRSSASRRRGCALRRRGGGPRPRRSRRDASASGSGRDGCTSSTRPTERALSRL